MNAILKELEIEINLENYEGYREHEIYEELFNDRYSNGYEIDGIEYLILNKEEKQKTLIEYIEETLWAFDSTFLADFTGIDYEVFEAIQKNNRYESNNQAIRSLIIGTNNSIEDFVDEAVHYNGAGHFLSTYDGQEIEVFDDNVELYVYRV